jgi:hypothetical protein
MITSGSEGSGAMQWTGTVDGKCRKMKIRSEVNGMKLREMGCKGIKSRTHKGRLCCWLMEDKWCLEGQAVLKDAYAQVN